MNTKKIIIIARKGESTNIVFNRLIENFTIHSVILEQPINRIQFLRRRIKKLGFLKVFGQVLFQLLIVPVLKYTSKKRIIKLKAIYHLNTQSISPDKVKNVDSINSDSTLQNLLSENPDLIIVNGTRIISKKTLLSVNCNFINIHAGITPNYRGVHGAYWALVNKDFDNCGVTIHKIDAGIDTGPVLFHKKISISKEDNFITYPLIQLGEGLPFLINAIDDILKGIQKTSTLKKADSSNLWHHPSLSQYIFNRLFKKVK